jgi:hypothetical protein
MMNCSIKNKEKKKTTNDNFANCRSGRDGSLSNERRKRMQERCTSKRRETKGRMEQFGLNIMSGKLGLDDVSCLPSLLHSYNIRGHHR